jgi:protein TonB
MVKEICCLFIICTCVEVNFIANCQNKCDSVHYVFGAPEKLPEGNVLKFIDENLKYPETARKDKIEGKVTIRFWIDTLGYTLEHQIIKGIREDLDEEALRVAKLIKFVKPAMNNDKPIGMCFQVGILFRLSDKKLNSPPFEPIQGRCILKQQKNKMM